MNLDAIPDDRLTTALASLPRADVDPARAERIRARCQAALVGRQDTLQLEAAAAGPAWTRMLEPALVAGVSAAFLLEVVGRALSLEGF